MNNRLYSLLFRGWFRTQKRSSRKEYILRVLLMPIFYILCKVFFYIFHLNEYNIFNLIFGFIGACIIAPIFFLSFAQVFFVTHRRLHDLNASGWWQLITFIPFGQILMIGFIFFKGTKGTNRYGESPKY